MRLPTRRWHVVLVNTRTDTAHPTLLARTWRRSSAERAARAARETWAGAGLAAVVERR